jgi:formate dehydrogenase iron-sulfur subunit
VVCGIAGVGASARLYLVPGRPAWNSPLTFLEFFSTVTLFGFSFTALLHSGLQPNWRGVLASGIAALVVLAAKLVRLSRSSRYELYGSWQLLSSVLANKLLVRVLLLIVGVSFTIAAASLIARIAGLLLLLAGEFVGRYLFFTSVVPSNIASSYFAREAA